jgi:hypothetical protein
MDLPEGVSILMIKNKKNEIYQSVRFDFILGVMHLGSAPRAFEIFCSAFAVTGLDFSFWRLLIIGEKNGFDA